MAVVVVHTLGILKYYIKKNSAIYRTLRMLRFQLNTLVSAKVLHNNIIRNVL